MAIENFVQSVTPVLVKKWTKQYAGWADGQTASPSAADRISAAWDLVKEYANGDDELPLSEEFAEGLADMLYRIECLGGSMGAAAVVILEALDNHLGTI